MSEQSLAKIKNIRKSRIEKFVQLITENLHKQKPPNRIGGFCVYFYHHSNRNSVIFKVRFPHRRSDMLCRSGYIRTSRLRGEGARLLA